MTNDSNSRLPSKPSLRRRQHLRFRLDQQRSPASWIAQILEKARDRPEGMVEKYLVGAILTQVHSALEIPVYPGTAADAHTGRFGDFQVGTTVYHVTAAPGEAVIRKTEENCHAGLHPVLLVPERVKARADFLAEHLGMKDRVTILAIEDFFSINILKMSGRQNREYIDTLKRIVDEYNRRIEEAETDQSLQIDIG